jgi:hypothetical protein
VTVEMCRCGQQGCRECVPGPSPRGPGDSLFAAGDAAAEERRQRLIRAPDSTQRPGVGWLLAGLNMLLAGLLYQAPTYRGRGLSPASLLVVFGGGLTVLWIRDSLKEFRRARRLRFLQPEVPSKMPDPTPPPVKIKPKRPLPTGPSPARAASAPASDTSGYPAVGQPQRIGSQPCPCRAGELVYYEHYNPENRHGDFSYSLTLEGKGCSCREHFDITSWAAGTMVFNRRQRSASLPNKYQYLGSRECVASDPP